MTGGCAYMRTTIEMKPEHRARLLELTASGGEKGLSAVVADALELYFAEQDRRVSAIRSALALKGSMSETECAALATQAQKVRTNRAMTIGRARQPFREATCLPAPETAGEPIQNLPELERRLPVHA